MESSKRTSGADDRHPFLERAAEAFTGNDIWTLILLIASMTAAGVSLYATYNGFAHYTSETVALLLSVAVQGGLLALAWLIGAASRTRRPRLIGLYVCTMLFSVTFSYVFFHSVLASTAKARETRTALVDTLRERKAELGELVQEGVSEASALSTALHLWTDDEARYGRTTFDCSARREPYLVKLCAEIHDRVEAWERSRERRYDLGAGEGLRYRILRSERTAVDSMASELRAANRALESDTTLASPTLSNRQLLTWYDGLRSQVPVVALERVLQREISLPRLPKYRNFADPEDSTDENPFSAFYDLAAFGTLVTGGGEMPLSRQMAIFSLLLAVFIDGFVLAVAIGGARPTEERIVNGDLLDPDQPGELSPELRTALTEWTRTATLGEAASERARARFISTVFDSIEHRGGRNILQPDSAEEKRFATLLAGAGLATLQRNGASRGERELFLLRDETMTLLSRYFNVLTQSDAA